MHRVLLLTGSLFVACLVHAQRVIDITNNDADVIGNERMRGLAGGSIFPPDKYIKIKEGSPYYSDVWVSGSLVLENGMTFQHLDLKLDLLNHEIHYKDANDREMILSTPVKQIIFHPGLDGRVFIQGKPWSAMDKKLATDWLQVLVNDTVSLLLDLRKRMVETTAYNSATTEQTIEEKEVYFLQKDGKLIPVPRWNDLFELLRDKKRELMRYSKEMDLTGDTPVEYAQLVAYYNKL